MLPQKVLQSAVRVIAMVCFFSCDDDAKSIQEKIFIHGVCSYEDWELLIIRILSGREGEVNK